jgi:hypothetical protein
MEVAELCRCMDLRLSVASVHCCHSGGTAAVPLLPYTLQLSWAEMADIQQQQRGFHTSFTWRSSQVTILWHIRWIYSIVAAPQSWFQSYFTHA